MDLSFVAALDDAAEKPTQRTPDIGAQDFECTDRPFFSRAVSKKFNQPVFGVLAQGNRQLPVMVAAWGLVRRHNETIGGVR